MTSLEIILTAVCTALLAAVIALFISNRRLHKNIDGLTDSIENFIEKDIPIGFSTSDNRFARLQNSVSDLENLYRLEQTRTENESRKNTKFISDISHQLKTPLAAIKLYVEMEHSESPSEHTEKEMMLIEKMESLILRLLRLEKIRSDSYIMDFQPEDMKNIAEEVVGEFIPLYPNKRFSVSGSSCLRLDKAWMTEAIANVVKNACEHTADSGRISIIIDENEKSTSVSIRDNGGGVEEEELTKLFKRFHRAPNSSPNSAGIGLAITRAVVEKHHGTVTAENTGEGLNIIMCFPHIDGYITI